MTEQAAYENSNLKKSEQKPLVRQEETVGSCFMAWVWLVQHHHQVDGLYL